MSLEDKLEALRREWVDATESRRSTIELQAKVLKLAIEKRDAKRGWKTKPKKVDKSDDTFKIQDEVGEEASFEETVKQILF